MSKEHQLQSVRVKCVNDLTCGIEHTAIIMIEGGFHKHIQCPACGQFTKQGKLKIVITYPKVLTP
jgi:hypothetical protein